jgi:hypothetical protein
MSLKALMKSVDERKRCWGFESGRTRIIWPDLEHPSWIWIRRITGESSDFLNILLLQILPQAVQKYIDNIDTRDDLVRNNWDFEVNTVGFRFGAESKRRVGSGSVSKWPGYESPTATALFAAPWQTVISPPVTSRHNVSSYVYTGNY